MAIIRCVAGGGIPKLCAVIYNLTGLTTSGATTVNAYTSLRFTLTAVGARANPDTIRIWMGGALLTQGVEYAYDKTSGLVVIGTVYGDITVEAVGTPATVIYSPAAGYNWVGIFRLEGNSIGSGYYICWFNAKPGDGWKPAYGSAAWNMITGSGTAYAYWQSCRYSQRFASAEAALNALYRKNSASYASGNIRIADGYFGQFSGTTLSVRAPWSVAAANFSATYYELYSVRAWFGGTSLGQHEDSYYGLQSIQPSIEYDAIVVQ